MTEKHDLRRAQAARVLSREWMKIRERNMLRVFRAASVRVPAYKDFLKKHRIKASAIKTLRDFQSVPPTSKADYLRMYPLKDLCWDGTLARPIVFAATSGSTGKPFYFPREEKLAREYAAVWNMFFENAKPKQRPILVIICFGMGVWVGGMITYEAVSLASRNGRNVSILTPGINKEEILNALKNLAPHFAQTILVGYPPFIKDVLEEALTAHIPLRRMNIRLFFAAESFSETFRDHLAKSAGIQNVHRDTLNVYGTADIGAMAFETPTSILLRRLAVFDRTLFLRLFGDTAKTPTLAQFDPYFTNFESENGEIFLTGDSTTPLVRYAVGDRGGVFSFDDAASAPELSRPTLNHAAKKYDAPLLELPFVYVYERADFSVKLYGATIFPEHVREALQEETLLERITGKFSMQVLTDQKHDQYLEVNVELARGARAPAALKTKVVYAIVKHLLAKNGEYKNNYGSMKDRVIPRVLFWPYEDSRYFKPGVKQKWVKQT